MFFAPNQVGGQGLGQFVSKPFNLRIKMSEKATGHARMDYHLTAMTKMEEFLARYKNPSQAIHTLGQRGETDDGKQSEGDRVITEDCDVVW